MDSSKYSMIALPVELRAGILQYCDLQWYAEMPALTCALRMRGLEDWCQHALELFYKLLTFPDTLGISKRSNEYQGMLSARSTNWFSQSSEPQTAYVSFANPADPYTV